MSLLVAIWSSALPQGLESFLKRKALEILFQIHSGVQAGDLIGVAVEHQGRALEEFAEPAFFGLTPARMIHIRIHVGIETVLHGSGNVPGIQRLAVGEANAHDRFRTLETVLPGQDDAERSAILVGKVLAIHAKT